MKEEENLLKEKEENLLEGKEENLLEGKEEKEEKKEKEEKEEKKEKKEIDNLKINDEYIIEKEILDNNDKNEKQPRCYRCTGDIMVGLTYLGRIILTLYSFHGLFFVYNIIFQYVILFAAVLYDIKNMFLRIIMTFIYFIFFYCW